MLKSEIFCIFVAIQRERRNKDKNEGDFQWLRKARVPYITVSVQEE